MAEKRSRSRVESSADKPAGAGKKKARSDGRDGEATPTSAAAATSSAVVPRETAEEWQSRKWKEFFATSEISQTHIEPLLGPGWTAILMEACGAAISWKRGETSKKAAFAARRKKRGLKKLEITRLKVGHEDSCAYGVSYLQVSLRERAIPSPHCTPVPLTHASVVRRSRVEAQREAKPRSGKAGEPRGVRAPV